MPDILSNKRKIRSSSFPPFLPPFLCFFLPLFLPYLVRRHQGGRARLQARQNLPQPIRKRPKSRRPSINSPRRGMRGLRNRDIIKRVGRLTRLTHQGKAFDLHEDHLFACSLLLLCACAQDGGGKKEVAVRVQCLPFWCAVGGRGREGVGVGKREMGRTEHQDIQLNFL